MESKQERINIDKLLITELSNDGTLVRRDILIPHPHTSTLSKLLDMSENPNRSLLEMQDVFKQDVYSQDEHDLGGGRFPGRRSGADHGPQLCL